jgi:hypothetical protein
MLKKINKKYFKLLKTLKFSCSTSEINEGIKKLNHIHWQRYEKNFKNGKPNSRFDVNLILFKNPMYRKVVKSLLLSETNKNDQYWNNRLEYWEPLFAKFNDFISNEEELFQTTKSQNLLTF